MWWALAGMVRSQLPALKGWRKMDACKEKADTVIHTVLIFIAYIEHGFCTHLIHTCETHSASEAKQIKK